MTPTRPWTVLAGDCRQTLADLPAESIDACVTDTPYGLSTLLDPPNLDREALWAKLTSGAKESPIKTLMRAWLDTGENPVMKGRGFMGKEWDALVPPPNTWKVIWRVLKPGAYCLAFGGTRTYALIEMSLRIADFEVEDTVSWLYGCLSEDTEIMVDGEWRHWTAAVAGSTVMAYSLEDDALRPEVVQDLVVYDYDDTAFHVRGDRTDHIVSRNHRCLVAGDGRWGFTIAEALQATCAIPVIEGDDDLRDVWQVLRSAQVTPNSGEDANVLAQVQRCLQGRGVGEAWPQGARRVDCRVTGIVSHENDGREEPGMARRCDAERQAGELRGCSVRAMPGGVHADGQAGRVHHGASTSGGTGDRSHLDSDRGGAPHQPRLARQPTGEPDAVRHEPGSQALRGERHARADLATVTPIHYRGKVWCVRVPSGAFVARRNGQVFITGNSGFPKRVRLDLKIDQHLGKVGDRPVIGKYTSKHLPNVGWGEGLMSREERPPPQNKTGPATSDAARFVGWDRALRPGWEPIIVACKPLRGTVAESALAHGTGGLHVDACRLPRDDAGQPTGGARRANPRLEFRYHTDGTMMPSIDGRGGYPANVAMDEETAAALDRMSGPCGGNAPASGPTFIGESTSVAHGKRNGAGDAPAKFHGRADGASRFFYTAKASSSERDAGLEDLPPLTAGERCDREDGSAGVNGYAGTRGEGGRNPGPCVKPLSLMRWLTRMASPPGAWVPDESQRPIIVDPFAGSGSTLVAGLLEGVRVIGCEMDPVMVDVARRRCQHAYALPRDDEQAPERNEERKGQASLF